MGWGEPQTGLAIGWCTRGGGGLLSWHSQKRDGRLREAGSYGELVSVTVPADVLAASAPAGEIVVRLKVDETVPGGLAVYSEEFGRYPSTRRWCSRRCMLTLMQRRSGRTEVVLAFGPSPIP